MRQRSAPYPYVKLAECFEHLIRIKEMNQDRYSAEEISKVLKLSAKSNVFRSKISTMRQYGLLDGQKGIYCLTKLANRYISAASEDEKEQCTQKAFLNVPLYNKIMKKFNHQLLPSEEQLAQVLLEEEFGLTNATIHIAAKVFIENSAELGILKDGILDMEERNNIPNEKYVETVCVEKEHKEENDLKMQYDEQNGILSEPAKEDFGKYIFMIPGDPKKSTGLIFPQDLTEKDWEILKIIFSRMTLDEMKRWSNKYKGNETE